MDAERKSGCGSFVRKAILVAILTVVAAKLVDRLCPDWMTRLKERMTSCRRGCGGCCGCCGEAAATEPADTANSAPAAESEAEHAD